MNLQIPSRIGQIFLAVPFLFFGIIHLMSGSAMAGMVPIPPGTFWIYLTGVAQILAAIAFIFNVKVRLAAYLTALYLLIIVLSIQLPHTLQGDQTARMMLVKDLGLMGGALLLGTLSPAPAKAAA